MNKFYKILTIIGGAITFIISVFFYGKKKGQDEVNIEILKENAEDEKKIAKIENDIARSSDNELREQLREFTTKG